MAAINIISVGMMLWLLPYHLQNIFQVCNELALFGLVLGSFSAPRNDRRGGGV